MTPDARPPFRAVRAALFAAVCVVLAAAGHAAMSGAAIPPGVLAAALAAVGAAAWLAAGRQRGLPAITGGVLTVQAALHLAFAAAQGADSSHMAHMGNAAHMDGMTGVHGTGGMHVMHGMTPGMTAAHLLAALLCALWLRRGEAAFFQLLRCVAALAFRALRLVVAVCRAPEPVRKARTPERTRPRVPRWELIADAVSRRGPPPGAVLRTTAPNGPPLPC
ncbi:hypothetical protein [Streptomyces violens]|uniref:hypothetical protein n=1 Tax=Streptomyces violens TaxID=66377 RepID=UPI00055F64A5|nr:hypothetical protein [Streptomyces violens]